MQDYIGAVVLNQAGDIYLIKEDDTNQIGQGRWNLPGGSSDDHESLLDSVVREVMEETGYTVEVTSLLGCYKSFKGNASWLYIVFETHVVSMQSQVLDASVKDGKWFTDEEFMQVSNSEIVHSDMKLVYKLARSQKGLALDSVKFINYG